mgnify:CR=1 FL=1|tara:strand:- start:4726 stop:5013 length:288 start_codon:yes stop_codon:yes gene_type:complete
MEDTYVYLSVKLYLKDGQTEDTIQEIIQDCDYHFAHSEIIEHEIKDIIDMQIPDKNQTDLFDKSMSPEDMGGMFEKASGMPDFVDPFDLTPFEGE